jgi:hypothetical protein
MEGVEQFSVQAFADHYNKRQIILENQVYLRLKIWSCVSPIRLGGYTQTANYSGGVVICDIKDGTEITPKWVNDIPGATSQLTDYTETYSPEVVEWFRNAKQVYYIWHGSRVRFSTFTNS